MVHDLDDLELILAIHVSLSATVYLCSSEKFSLIVIPCVQAEFLLIGVVRHVSANAPVMISHLRSECCCIECILIKVSQQLSA